jgi:hypothetical protein
MRFASISRALGLAALTGLLCGCASTDDNLQRASATQIGNTLTKDVAVSNVNRKATSVSWSAKAPSGCYECDADDMVRRPHCVKVDCPK